MICVFLYFTYRIICLIYLKQTVRFVLCKGINYFHFDMEEKWGFVRSVTRYQYMHQLASQRHTHTHMKTVR